LRIREYDHPREIIVDLLRSIYREIHNLFNLGRQIKRKRERERERERKRKGGKRKREEATLGVEENQRLCSKG